MPYTWYSVVINNPTADDEACLTAARKNGYVIEGQLEKGKNGTPHYQLAVGTQDSWKDVKAAFPRANVQEAHDPVALRKYVVKTETRLVDFTLPKPTKCLPAKISNTGFFDALFQQIYESCGTLSAMKEAVEKDTLLTCYDNAVCGVMASASTADCALTFATRAIRPDVRAIYRRYRSSMLNMWSPEQIDVPMNIQDADDDESLEQDAGGSVGEEHLDEEATEGSEGEGTDDETEGSGEGSSEGTSGD